MGDRGRIWVGDLLPECEEQDLRAYFGKFGQIREARIEREKRTSLSRGFGFISMGSQLLVDKVLKEKHLIWENVVTVKLASEVTVEPEAPAPDEPKSNHSADDSNKRKAQDEAPKGETDPGKFVVSNLPEDVTEEQLKSHFESFGEVSVVAISKDPQTGKPKNYGSVTFAQPNADADDLIAEQQHEIDGKKFDVRRAKRVKFPKGAGKGAAPAARLGGAAPAARLGGAAPSARPAGYGAPARPSVGFSTAGKLAPRIALGGKGAAPGKGGPQRRW